MTGTTLHGLLRSELEMLLGGAPSQLS